MITMNSTFLRHIARLLIGLVGTLILMSVSSAPAMSQMPIKLRVAPEVPPDSADVARGTKRHFWRASAEVVGFNLGLWAFDRYIQKGDFAYISLKTIRDNFRVGFKWDNDKLGTNTFLHPYNGNLYYNAARSNGFNYWQSTLFAIGGSAMWEMFMECEYPSTNDIIATPIGGAAIGEIMFRASDVVLDDRSTGWERAGREAAAFVISPLRGFNRLITGDMWRRRPTTGRIFGTPNVAIQFSTGVKALVCQGRFNGGRVGASAQIDVEYGDRFEIRSTAPFDYFTVRAELQFMRDQPLLSHLSIKGRLLAREFLKERDTHLSVGLFQHFDFYDSDTIRGINRNPYKLGIPASVGAGIYYRDIDRGGWVFDAFGHFNGVILGSILSDHYQSDERNYNWASGFSVKVGANLVFRRDRFSLAVTNELYRLYTWVGYRTGVDPRKADYRTLNVQGDKSSAYFNVTEVTANLRLWGRLYGTLSFMNFFRSTKYRDFPDIRSSSMTLALHLTYKL